MIPEDAKTSRYTRRSLMAATALGITTGVQLTATHAGAQRAAAQPAGPEVLWTFQTGEWHQRHDPDFDGRPIILNQDGRLFALDPETGNNAWLRQYGANDIPYYIDDQLYLLDGSLVRLDLATGAERWTAPAQTGLAIAGDRVYVVYHDGTCCALNADSGSERWRYLSGSTAHEFRRPVVAGDTVYFNDSDGAIFAVDTDSGLERWRFVSDDNLSIEAAVDHSVIAAGYDNETFLLVLDAATGSIRWRRNVGTTPTPLNAIDDTFFFVDDATDERFLRAVDIATGSERWSLLSETQVWTNPVVLAGRIYVGNGRGVVYALDAETGAEQWRYATGGVVSGGAVLIDGVVYFGSTLGTAVALNAATGERRWEFNTGRSTPVPVYRNGTLVWRCAAGNIVRLDPGTGEERWRLATELELRAAPVVVGNRLFVGSSDNHVYALDATKGSELWRLRTSGRLQASPATEESTLYVTNDQGDVYALDHETGQERWRFSTNDTITTSPVVADDHVYVGGGGNFAYALDAETGQELWRFDAEGDIHSSPIVTERGILVTNIDGTLFQVSGASGERNWWFETGMTITHTPGSSDWMVFLATEDGLMLALQSGDGMELWRATTHFYGFTMPPAVFDDVVYIGVSGEGLYALNAETGEGLWPLTSESRTLGDDIWAESAVAADGVLYVGGTGAVYAFTTAHGYELWGYRTFASVSSPPAVHRGTVYVADEGGRVFALDAATGAEHWVFDTGRPITSSPVVAGNIVYVSSWDGAVYAFPSVPPPIESGMAAVVVIETPLRAEAGLAGEETAMLKAGTQVYISGDSVWRDDTYWWPVIAADGSTGWVDGSTLRGEY